MGLSLTLNDIEVRPSRFNWSGDKMIAGENVVSVNLDCRPSKRGPSGWTGQDRVIEG